MRPGYRNPSLSTRGSIRLFELRRANRRISVRQAPAEGIAGAQSPTENEFRLFQNLASHPGKKPGSMSNLNSASPMDSGLRRNDEWGDLVRPQFSAHFRSASEALLAESPLLRGILLLMGEV
jgi:hypothetical protein